MGLLYQYVGGLQVRSRKEELLRLCSDANAVHDLGRQSALVASLGGSPGLALRFSAILTCVVSIDLSDLQSRLLLPTGCLDRGKPMDRVTFHRAVHQNLVSWRAIGVAPHSEGEGACFAYLLWATLHRRSDSVRYSLSDVLLHGFLCCL